MLCVGDVGVSKALVSKARRKRCLMLRQTCNLCTVHTIARGIPNSAFYYHTMLQSNHYRFEKSSRCRFNGLHPEISLSQEAKVPPWSVSINVRMQERNEKFLHKKIVGEAPSPNANILLPWPNQISNQFVGGILSESQPRRKWTRSRREKQLFQHPRLTKRKRRERERPPG